MIELDGPSPLIFLIRRFMREMKRCLDVTVAWSTHTRYAPIGDGSDPFAIEPIRHPKTKETVVPAIGLIGPTVLPDQNSFSAHPVMVSRRITTPAGQSVEGHAFYRPSQIVDVEFEIQIFHNRKVALWNLAERFRRYFIQNPYLVVPSDRNDDDGVTIPDHRQFITDFWSESPPDQSREGTVVYQRVPHDAPILTSTSPSNSDNLFVTESSVLLENVALPDEELVAEREAVSEITIDFYDKEDPDETVQLSFTVTAEE